MTAEFETDLLSDLLRGKRSCLVQLRDMGRRQLELIEAGDMTGLLDLLACKQRAIHQLQRLERALDPFRHDDPAQRRWRTAQLRLQCAEHLEECETLLREIVNHERCGEAMLQRRRDEAAAQLQGAHVASQARSAYQPTYAADNVNQLDLSLD
jgi:hypothetical protein